MPRHQLDLVADPQPIGRARDREPAVLVGGALVGRGRLVPDSRRPRVEGQRLQPGIDDGALLGRAAHDRRPHEQARLESVDRRPVAVEIAAVIGVHEDVGAAL